MTISKELKTRSKQTEKHFLEKTLRGNIYGRSKMNTTNNTNNKKARDKQSRRCLHQGIININKKHTHYQ